MFEALNRAFVEAKEKDEEKLLRRKSRRISHRHTLQLHDLEDGIGEEDFGDEVIEGEYHDDKAAGASIGSDLSEDEDDLIEDREKWDTDYIVVVHMIAFAVGGSNVWRFGFLCYTNGGIAFLIPYFLLTVLCAFPCVYLELLIGQYAQVGAIAAWKLVPIFKGVGMCMTLVGFMICFNIQSMITWCLFYMFQSVFSHPLPWISCDNGFGKLSNGQSDDSLKKWVPGEDENKNWHTENCTEFFADSGTDGSLTKNQHLPGSEYFRGRVQRMWKSGYADRKIDSNFTEDNGKIIFGLASEEEDILVFNTDTFMALIVTFIIIEICIARGIKAHAKTMVILTIAPYVWLIMLFYRATGLRGAWAGLGDLFRPDFSKLLLPDTWLKCLEQVFYSTGAGVGIHLACASHNPLSRRIVYDAVVTIIVDFLTNLLAASTIFMFLGHVCVAVNRGLDVFISSGPELVFEVMSDVLGVLAKANFYAFSFYLCIFLLALTTVTTSLICVKTSFLEVLPVTLKYKTGVRIMLMAILYVTSFIISGLNLTRGGLHTYNFLDKFIGMYSLILTALLFVIGIAWMFGLREIVDSTVAMNIRTPGIFFQISWKFVCPAILGIGFFGMIFDNGTHRLRFDGKDVPLPPSVLVVGYLLAIGPFALVIGGAIHAVWYAPGKNFKEKMLISISPTNEHNEILATGTGKRAKLSHYLYFYAPTPGVDYNICCYLQQLYGHNHRLSQVAPTLDIVVVDSGTSDHDDRIGGDIGDKRQ